MAKNSITDYSKTASSNTDIQSVDIDEGCLPSGINNAIRELMADLADMNDGTVSLTSPAFTSVDINGGTIDGAVIGGASAAAGTFTTGQFNTSLNVDGTVTADGLTVDGLAAISAQTNGAYALRVGDATGGSGSVVGVGKIGINQFSATSNTYTGTEIRATENSGGDYRARLSFHTRVSASDVEPLERLRIDYNGDISFYEDTGTTAKLFWDASEERLGIGTTSPSASLHISGNIIADNTAGSYIQIKKSGTNSAFVGEVESGLGSGDGLLLYTYTGTDRPIIAYTNGSEAMRITSAGRVGIGTSSPLARFDVESGTGNVGFNYGTLSSPDRGNLWYDTDGTGWRFNIGKVQSGSFTSQITIVDTGKVGIGTASPASLLEVKGSTGYATSGGTLIVRQDGDTNSDGIAITSSFSTSHRIWKNSSGVLNIGPSSLPSALVQDLSGNLLVGKTSSSLSTTGVELGNGYSYFTSSGINQYINRTSNGETVNFYRSGTKVGSITVTTTSTAYNTSSDYRLKENVTGITDGIERVKQLNPSRFNFIADADRTVDGFLAHEAATVVPEAVTGEKDAMRDEEYEVTPAVLDDDGNVVTEAVMGTRSVPDYQGIDQAKLVPLLTAALQEAITKIEDLEARVATLEGN